MGAPLWGLPLVFRREVRYGKMLGVQGSGCLRKQSLYHAGTNSLWEKNEVFHLLFPGGASGKEPTCQCRRHETRGSIPGKMSLRRKWQPTPIFLPGEFHGQRSLAGYSPWGGKESDTTKHMCTVFQPATIKKLHASTCLYSCVYADMRVCLMSKSDVKVPLSL